MTPRWPPLPRRLPRPPAPLRWETLDSYLTRLATANQISISDITALASISHHDPATLDRLTALTGSPATTLLHALPELRHHPAALALPDDAYPTPQTFINDIRPPCRRCAATAGADPHIAHVWATHDTCICLRHQLWIGDGNDHPSHQPSLAATPDIICAQLRHHRIVRHRGRPATRAAFRTAQGTWPSLTDLPAYSKPRNTRIAQLWPLNPSTTPSGALTQAADYPETVAFTAMLASPYWRAIALSRSPAGNQRFHHEFRRRVAPGHHEQQYPRFLFWLRRDLEWHPEQADDTGPYPPTADPRHRTPASVARRDAS